MPKRTGDYDAWLLNELTDPKLAASYVNAAICEDPDLLKVALRNVAKAHTMKKVAKEAGVARESLYTILSEEGNPTLANLNGVLKAVGLRVAVVTDSEESSVQEAKPEPKHRLHIDSSALRAIGGLTMAANVNVGTTNIRGFFGAEPPLGCNFNTQFGLGTYIRDPLELRLAESAPPHALQDVIQNQSGSVDIYKAVSASAGIGCIQPSF